MSEFSSVKRTAELTSPSGIAYGFNNVDDARTAMKALNNWSPVDTGPWTGKIIKTVTTITTDELTP